MKSLSAADQKKVVQEILDRLDDFKEQVKRNGLCALNFENVSSKDRFTDKANDSLASGDMLGCFMWDTMSNMDEVDFSKYSDEPESEEE